MDARPHRIVTRRMLVVSVVVGVVLAVVSVPVAAIAGHVQQAVQSGFPDPDWEGDIDRGDHVEMISRWRWIGQRMWATQWCPRPLEPAWQRQLSGWIEPADDPRPAFARRPYQGDAQAVYTHSFGWPWHGGIGRATTQRSPAGWSPFHYEGLVEVPFRSTTVRFPLRPIWSGLLANTLFYTAITLGLLVGVRAPRIWHRRARGRCVACGYELGDGVGVCPECGLAARRPDEPLA
ncbi:MAG: hypothetical protein ACIAQU_05960 [Phycisphaerales bacterium JB064]